MTTTKIPVKAFTSKWNQTHVWHADCKYQPKTKRTWLKVQETTLDTLKDTPNLSLHPSTLFGCRCGTH